MKVIPKLTLLILFVPLLAFGTGKEVNKITPDSCEKDLLKMSDEEITYCSGVMSASIKKDMDSLINETIELLNTKYSEEIAERFKQTQTTWVSLKDQMCNLKMLTALNAQYSQAMCRLEYDESRYDELRYYFDTIK